MKKIGNFNRIYKRFIITYNCLNLSKTLFKNNDKYNVCQKCERINFERDKYVDFYIFIFGELIKLQTFVNIQTI